MTKCRHVHHKAPGASTRLILANLTDRPLAYAVAKSKDLARVRAKLVFVKRPPTLSVKDISLVLKR